MTFFTMYYFSDATVLLSLFSPSIYLGDPEFSYLDPRFYCNKYMPYLGFLKKATEDPDKV